MRKRRWAMLAAVLVLCTVLAWGVAPRPIAVEAASVTSGAFDTALEDEGKTRLPDQYVVSAPMARMIGRIGLREGDHVERGAVVASPRKKISTAPAYAARWPSMRPNRQAPRRRRAPIRAGCQSRQLRAVSAYRCVRRSRGKSCA